MNRRNKIIVSAASVAALGTIGAVAATDDGYETPAPKQNQYQQKDPGAPAEPSPRGDVKIKSFKVYDYFQDGTGDREAVVDLSITNHSSKVSDYSVTVEVVDASGKRVEELFAYGDKVAPGQTVDTAPKNDGGENAIGTADSATGKSARVLSVDRLASIG